MPVETISLEHFVCDRCDKVEDIPCGTGLDRRATWSWANAQFYQGGALFRYDYKMTLCPDCSRSLREWSRPAEVEPEING